MAAAIKAPWISSSPSAASPLHPLSSALGNESHLADFAGVFRGRELTRKARRLASGIDALDAILDGGIARGRVSEVIGRAGTGRTSLVAAFAANATGSGEVIAWIDAAGAFDPTSIAAAGVELARVLWVSIPREANRARLTSSREGRILKAAEMVLEAGGFGLVVIDFGDIFRAIPDSAVLRIARAAERSGAAVIAIAPRRICGTFAALSLTMNRASASFSRIRPGAPALFDGLRLESVITRNKLGGSGAVTRIIAAIDPVCDAPLSDADIARAHPERPRLAGEACRPRRIGKGSGHSSEHEPAESSATYGDISRINRSGSPSRVGRDQGLGRNDSADAPERPRNFNRAALRSALNNVPHLASPLQGEGSDAAADAAR